MKTSAVLPSGTRIAWSSADDTESRSVRVPDAETALEELRTLLADGDEPACYGVAA